MSALVFSMALAAIATFISPQASALNSHLTPSDDMRRATTSGVDDSARRARSGDFDVEGTIASSQERGQELGECTAGVARGDKGNATAVVRFANGFSRTLTFMRGEFTSANPTMSGTGSDNDWSKNEGLFRIRVDDQRYELPAALLFGH